LGSRRRCSPRQNCLVWAEGLPILEAPVRHEAEARRMAAGLHARFRSELAENGRNVMVYRPRRKTQTPGDLRVAQILREEQQHLQLAFRELGWPRAGARTRTTWQPTRAESPQPLGCLEAASPGSRWTVAPPAQLRFRAPRTNSAARAAADRHPVGAGCQANAIARARAGACQSRRRLVMHVHRRG
jgi:hypothetical protein